MDQKVKYTNYHLANLKLSGLSDRVLRLDSVEDDNEKDEILETVLGLVRYVQEVSNSREYLISELELLEKTRERDLEQREHLESELCSERKILKNVNRELLMQRKETKSVSLAYSKLQDEAKQQATANQQKTVQYQHELRKKEREHFKLQSRLQRHLDHVYSTKKLGMRNISTPGSTSKRSIPTTRATSASSTASSGEQVAANARLHDRTCQEYEERIHELILENQMLKRTLYDVYRGMAALVTDASTSCQSVLLEKSRFDLPYYLSRPDIEDNFSLILRRLSTALEGLPNQQSHSQKVESLAIEKQQLLALVHQLANEKDELAQHLQALYASEEEDLANASSDTVTRNTVTARNSDGGDSVREYAHPKDAAAESGADSSYNTDGISATDGSNFDNSHEARRVSISDDVGYTESEAIVMSPSGVDKCSVTPRPLTRLDGGATNTPLMSILRRTPPSGSNPSTASKSISFADNNDVITAQVSSASPSSSFSFTQYSIEDSETSADSETEPEFFGSGQTASGPFETRDTEGNSVSDATDVSTTSDSKSVLTPLYNQVVAMLPEKTIKQLPVYSPKSKGSPFVKQLM